MDTQAKINIYICIIFLIIIFFIFYYYFFNKKSERTVQNALNSSSVITGQSIAMIDSSGNISTLSYPTGMIMLWYPPNKDHLNLNLIKDDIPNGWAICDGENGTPDLRGRFVLMAQDAPIKDVPGSSSHQIRQIGGEETHVLTISEMPSHSHGYWDSEGSSRGNLNGDNRGSTYQRTSAEGGSQPHNNMPPFYTLVYIMKL